MKFKGYEVFEKCLCIFGCLGFFYPRLEVNNRESHSSKVGLFIIASARKQSCKILTFLE